MSNNHKIMIFERNYNYIFQLPEKYCLHDIPATQCLCASHSWRLTGSWGLRRSSVGCRQQCYHRTVPPPTCAGAGNMKNCSLREKQLMEKPRGESPGTSHHRERGTGTRGRRGSSGRRRTPLQALSARRNYLQPISHYQS